MLRLIQEDERPVPAYLVPWRVDRSTAPRCILLNTGPDLLTSVSIQFFGDGWMEPALPRANVAPGDHVLVTLGGANVLDSARVTVHWRVGTDDEYAWTFVL